MHRTAGEKNDPACGASRAAVMGSPTPIASSPIVKRLFDIAVAGILLVSLLPLLALTALIVFIVLGRPLMFRQVRCGRGRTNFVISKFRTMTDARGVDGNPLADDLRQTEITAFLRRIRADELPQLLAVLRGEMSFVGPRPLPPDAIAAFGPAGTLRCQVAPGITGWAQVNGNTLLSNEQKIALDLWYVDRRSIQMDLRIVFMTIRTILLGERVNAGNVEVAMARFRFQV